MLVIWNNFFDNPEKIRTHAIKMFEKNHDCILNDSANYYPGIRVEVDEKIESKIQFFIETKFNKKIKQLICKFHITSRIHNLGLIHTDKQYPFAGLIYLNENPPKHSGTILCSKKNKNEIFLNGFETASITKDVSIIENFGKYKEIYNKENFYINTEIENKFNRLVIYKGSHYHAPYRYFGNNLFNSRLVLAFWFDMM